MAKEKNCRFLTVSILSLLVVIGLVIFSGCRKQSKNKDSLIYGFYYDQCDEDSDCFKGYLITENKLFRDKIKGYEDKPSFQISAESQDKFLVARELLDSIPIKELIEAGDFIGKPDQHDQGGIFISCEKDGQRYKGRVDVVSDRLPPEIAKFIKRIATVDKQLNQ